MFNFILIISAMFIPSIALACINDIGGYGMMSGWSNGSWAGWLMPFNALVWLVAGVLLIAYLLKKIK